MRPAAVIVRSSHAPGSWESRPPRAPPDNGRVGADFASPEALFGHLMHRDALWNQQLIQLYQRLTAAGKEHKRALVACARKMLIFANTVVARGTPWCDEPPAIKASMAGSSMAGSMMAGSMSVS